MRRRGSFSAILVSVGLIALAACGSDKNSASTTAAPTTAAPTTAAATTVAETTPATDAPTTVAETSPATTEPVVKQTIKIGVAWEDLSAFVSVNPAYGSGDPEQQALAVLDGWHRDGLLPVNGIDVEMVTKGYSAIDNDAKLGVCQDLGNEGDIFAVLGGRDFTAGAECLATRFQIPVIDTNQASDTLLAGAAPYMFTLKPSDTEIAKMWANYGVKSGQLAGKKVGIYWESEFSDAVDLMKTIITAGGATVASEVESGGQGSVGSDQDALAAQKFKQAGVDEVILMVGSSSIVNFLSAANDQGFKPGYVDADWASHLSDVAAGAYNQDEWGSTKAIANVTAGDLAAGLQAPAESCIKNYETFAGTTFDRTAPEKSGEYTNILITCDLASVFYAGLKAATDGGKDLTKENFIAGVESINGLKGAYWDTLSYSKDDHTGAATAREIQWDTSCPCWKPVGEWTPISDYLG